MGGPGHRCAASAPDRGRVVQAEMADTADGGEVRRRAVASDECVKSDRGAGWRRGSSEASAEARAKAGQVPPREAGASRTQLTHDEKVQLRDWLNLTEKAPASVNIREV